MPAAPNGFPKSARLLRRHEFTAVKKQGQRFAEGPLLANWKERPHADSPGLPAPGARVGLAVSAKVGGAVVRNRIKRCLREAVRQELCALPAVDLVLVPRASAAQVGVEEFRAFLRRAAARMSKREGR